MVENYRSGNIEYWRKDNNELIYRPEVELIRYYQLVDEDQRTDIQQFILILYINININYY